MKAVLIAFCLIGLVGCGKTLDQILTTGKNIIDIAGKTYEDVKDNYESAKKLVEPADPSKEKP